MERQNHRALPEKFLSLWEGAEPGIDEVEDARKRLGGVLVIEMKPMQLIESKFKF